MCGVNGKGGFALFKQNWINKAYLSGITVRNIYESFTHKMAAKTSWHRYGTKLRHCYPMHNAFSKQPPSWWKHYFLKTDYTIFLELFLCRKKFATGFCSTFGNSNTKVLITFLLIWDLLRQFFRIFCPGILKDTMLLRLRSPLPGSFTVYHMYHIMSIVTCSKIWFNWERYQFLTDTDIRHIGGSGIF